MTWHVQSILHEDVARLWPVVAPLLAPAVARSEGRYDMRAVLDDLRTGRSLLWVVYDDEAVVHAAFTARAAHYPRATWLVVDFLGGADLAQWVETCDSVLAAFARDGGYDGVELVGRHGWARALAAFGWRENAVMLSRAAAGGSERTQDG